MKIPRSRSYCSTVLTSSLLGVIGLALIGCSGDSVQTGGSGTLYLDNDGGYSGGAGRRLELQPNGFYMDVRYYNQGGGKDRTNTGGWMLNSEKTKITLSPDNGAKAQLFRVDYKGEQYWVTAGNMDGISKAKNDELRRASLRASR